MVIVIILAVMIESWKYVIRQIKKLKRDKEKLEFQFEMLKYVEGKNKSGNPTLFSDLIFDGYITYIKKMTQTLNKTHIWYDIDDEIASVFYIKDYGNLVANSKLRDCIYNEIQTTLGSVISYYDLIDNIGVDSLNRNINYAIDFIEDSIDFQIFCADEVLQYYLETHR